MIIYQYYPNYDRLPNHLVELINKLKQNHNIDSDFHKLVSDEVLALLKNDLTDLGYIVEQGKKRNQKIKIPVLFGRNSQIIKAFDVDAFNELNKTIFEIEAGRAVANNQFLKDIFQACVMVDVEYLVIAVRKVYRDSNDFEKIINFLETLYSSKRFILPIKGILLIGY
jgi:hypothetical protein